MNSRIDVDGIPKGSMRAAYLFQTVNLLVSILTVPVLLHYLNVAGYVLWSVFTVFGAVTLQLQNGIQPVAVREIAREYCETNIDALQDAIRRARAAYWVLAAFTGGPILIAGIAYLRLVVDRKLGATSIPEWLIFAAAYSLNYTFAANSAILLGTIKIAQQNNINSMTRTVYFFLTVLLLHEGLSVLGICISFAASVVLSCLLTARAANRRLREVHDLMRKHSANEGVSSNAPRQSISKYMLYSLAAYILYNGALLVATAIFPKEEVAVYGLSIQTFTLMSALAVVPVQVWLSKLVGAVRRRNHAQMLRELVVTVVAVNVVFCVAYILIALFGNFLLDVLGSTIHLLTGRDLLLTFIAYLVELNLIVFVNFLVTNGKYEFVRVYLFTSGASLSLAMLASWLTHNLILSLVVIPVTVQGAICLPMIFRLICDELLTSPRGFLAGVGAVFKSLV